MTRKPRTLDVIQVCEGRRWLDWEKREDVELRANALRNHGLKVRVKQEILK